MTSSLIAVHDSTSEYNGVGLAEETASIVEDIGNSSWVDPTLGGFADSVEWLSFALDPLSPLLGWAAEQGAGWLFGLVQPLNEPLDGLTGNADAVIAHEQAWNNVAQFAGQTREQYTDAVSDDTTHWLGATADAYRGYAEGHATVLDGIGQAAAGIAAAAAGAGLLVGRVRGIVADCIAQFANIIAGWLPAALFAEGVTAGMATPAIIARVANLVAKYVGKINHVIRALFNSMRQLARILDRLGDNLTDLTRLANRLRPRLAADGPTPGPLKFAMAEKDKDKDDIETWLGPRKKDEHVCDNDEYVASGNYYACSTCGAKQFDAWGG
jgi:hypothetical protein